MVDPRCMCRQHLLGEHVELHMFVGTINKNKKLNGFVKNGLVEVKSIKKRHADLVAEMERRGMSHKSPLPEFEEFDLGVVDAEVSRKELIKRCERCRKLFKGV